MNRPKKIKIKLTKLDKIVEIAGWAIIIAIWLLLWLHYFDLPEEIPTHYNIHGKADAYGAKYNLFFLPIIATILFVSITILNRYPHIFNYPTPITKENALRQYTLATRLIRGTKLLTSILFLIIMLNTTNISQVSAGRLNLWMIFAVIFLIFIFLIIYVIKSIQKK